MPAPERYARHLTDKGYHPRSDKHSNALAEYILDDLLEHCKAIAAHASSGQVVWDCNMQIQRGPVNWNIDLVIGDPPPPITPPPAGQAIRRSRPSTIRIAIELKGVMTEHGKARRNRLRDFEAFHSHVHGYDPDAVAAGLVVFNIAPEFLSPLREAVTQHRRVGELVAGGIDMFRGLPIRGATIGDGLEAVGVLVVSFTNLPDAVATLHEVAPAPAVGDPLHYQAFLQRVCQRYIQRWS